MPEDTSTAGRTGKVIHPRLPDDLHEWLTEYARQTHRSLNSAVAFGLSQFRDSVTGGEAAATDPKVHLR